MNPTSYTLFVLWGVGTVLVYGRLVWGQLRSWQRRKDRRARREAIGSFALFLTALASCASVFAVLVIPPGTPVRGFLVMLALGSFTGAGIVLQSEKGSSESVVPTTDG